MTTFIWWLLGYSLTVLISEGILVWALRSMKSQNRIKNIVDNPMVNWRYAVFFLALVPVINLLMAFSIARTAYYYKRAKEKTRVLANKLRDIGARHPELDGKMDPIADAIENLPDKE